jgi:hypothetical protein
MSATPGHRVMRATMALRVAIPRVQNAIEWTAPITRDFGEDLSLPQLEECGQIIAELGMIQQQLILASARLRALL